MIGIRTISWWKILAIVLVLYSIIGGFLIDVPKLPILHETIRNTYFHVTLWFAMMILMAISMVYSIKTLSNPLSKNDEIAAETANIGLFFGILGLVTGMIWAQFTWGAFWVNDVKTNGTAITLLIYFAYLVLRGSIEDSEKKARISAVYNIFAFVMLILFLGILPRVNDSLHPGNGGNPAFGNYDMDNTMRMVFYPSIIGYLLLGLWLVDNRIRLRKINEQLEAEE